MGLAGLAGGSLPASLFINKINVLHEKRGILLVLLVTSKQQARKKPMKSMLHGLLVLLI